MDWSGKQLPHRRAETESELKYLHIAPGLLDFPVRRLRHESTGPGAHYAHCATAVSQYHKRPWGRAPESESNPIARNRNFMHNALRTLGLAWLPRNRTDVAPVTAMSKIRTGEHSTMLPVQRMQRWSEDSGRLKAAQMQCTCHWSSYLPQWQNDKLVGARGLQSSSTD